MQGVYLSRSETGGIVMKRHLHGIVIFGVCVAAAGPALAEQAYAEVIQKTAVFREVRIEQPRQECHPVQVTKHVAASGTEQAVGTVAGGVIGGVLGHQVGKGRGKSVATVVGALAGAGAGNVVANKAGSSDQVVTEQRCTTVTESRVERRANGYDVDYRFAGAVYHGHTATDPGSRIPVTVTIAPQH